MSDRKPRGGAREKAAKQGIAGRGESGRRRGKNPTRLLLYHMSID